MIPMIFMISNNCDFKHICWGYQKKSVIVKQYNYTFLFYKKFKRYSTLFFPTQFKSSNAFFNLVTKEPSATRNHLRGS